MISIRKYLNGERRQNEQNLDRFCSAALDGVRRHVLTGDDRSALRTRLDAVEESILGKVGDEETEKAAADLDTLLAEHAALSQQAGSAQAIEMQHIVSMLNEALIVLVEGRHRSVSRLNKVQEELQRASMIQDIVALKQSLSETVRFVRAESAAAEEADKQEVGRLEQQINQAREYFRATPAQLAGREEAIKRIATALENPAPGKGLFVLAYLVDQLRAIIQRYGQPVADEVTLQLLRERVQPVATACATYRWTPLCALALFPGDPEELSAVRTRVAELNRAQMVYRTALGNRTAVLAVTPSHLIAVGRQGEGEALVEQLDRFAGIA